MKARLVGFLRVAILALLLGGCSQQGIGPAYMCASQTANVTVPSPCP